MSLSEEKMVGWWEVRSLGVDCPSYLWYASEQGQNAVWKYVKLSMSVIDSCCLPSWLPMGFSPQYLNPARLSLKADSAAHTPYLKGLPTQFHGSTMKMHPFAKCSFSLTVICSILTPDMWLWAKSEGERLTVGVMAALGLPTTPSYYKTSIQKCLIANRVAIVIFHYCLWFNNWHKEQEKISNDKMLHFKLLFTLRQNNDEVLWVSTTKNDTDREGVITWNAYFTSLAAAKRTLIINYKIKGWNNYMQQPANNLFLSFTISN